MEWNKKGFTLIELLVVVLVIGILAAVALPQYRVAVVKSQTAAMLPLLKAIAQANELYYLDNGIFTFNIHNLDIEMPTDCEDVSTNGGGCGPGQCWKCKKDFLIDNSGGNLPSLNHCPGENENWTTCAAARDFVIRINQSSHNFKISCSIYKDFGRRICGSLHFN